MAQTVTINSRTFPSAQTFTSPSFDVPDRLVASNTNITIQFTLPSANLLDAALRLTISIIDSNNNIILGTDFSGGSTPKDKFGNTLTGPNLSGSLDSFFNKTVRLQIVMNKGCTIGAVINIT